MAFKLKDGVWETTQTSGPGAYALDGKVADPAALHAFGDVFSDGDTFRYRVWGDDGEEEGIGQYDATNDQVTRVRVYRSTNGNSAVDWPAGGTKNITCDVASGALENLTDPDATGLLAQTAGETFARRSIQGGTNIAVTDGDGSGGNPSVAVSPQGAGSGLNADTVDGEHAAAFADAVHSHDGVYAPVGGGVSAATGGSAEEILRYNSSGTLTQADRNDSSSNLLSLLARGTDGEAYAPGSVVPWSGLTAGARYYLGDSGGITTVAPTPSSTVRLVYVGRALTASLLLFTPTRPIGG